MQNLRLKELKTYLKKQKIDYFLQPNSDEFFSEYLPQDQKRIEYLTGFTGSNAYVIFGQEKSYFFTDSRYTLQAKEQLDLNEFEILDLAKNPLISWIRNNLNEKKLALDSRLISVNFADAVKKGSDPFLTFLDTNPIDEIKKEDFCKIKSPIFAVPLSLAGIDSVTKRTQVIKSLNAEAVIITKPENLCWLLNIRASDIEFNPLLLTYAILFKNGAVELFADEERLRNLDLGHLPQVTFVQENCFDLRILVLRKTISKIQIDANTTNYWLYQLLQKNDFEIIFKNDEIENLKSVKNKAEIEGAIKAHEADGRALAKFLDWLKNNEADEISAAEKLLEFRKENKNFLYPSFATISGFASNGAIVHYHANNATNKKISGNSLYLVDSGGQYFGDFMGTTDVTRTVAIGKPTAEMIENFTRVLKGHIAIARAKFPRGTSGADLDALARFHLWQKGLNYGHGTGHGVGAFLSVHEGPCGISKRAVAELKAGMIISNEPGFYKEGEYGIRIENLMLVEKFDENFLCFKTLTRVPLDESLIDFKMLTYTEKKWLVEYKIYCEK